MTLVWNPSAGSNGPIIYELLRDGEPLRTVVDTTFTDDGLEHDHAYAYQAKAIDGQGNSSALTAQLVVTTKPEDGGGEVAEWQSGVDYKVGDR